MIVQPYLINSLDNVLPVENNQDFVVYLKSSFPQSNNLYI